MEREREITGPVDLCTADGRLAREAIGWSRRPLHRCNLAGPWPRQKRWEYWCITAGDVLLAVTVADVDYVGLAVVTVMDLVTGRVDERAAVAPLGRGVRLGERVGGTPITVERRDLEVALSTGEDGRTSIRAAARFRGGGTLRAELVVEPARETLNVVIPWDGAGGERFQFTSKQVCLPVAGTLERDGQPRTLDPATAFACLDFGRGVWPWRTEWCWAAAAGIANGRRLGINLGGRWTDGTGHTENGLFLDGRLHKLHDDVQFAVPPARTAPWRIASDRVSLRFTPLHHRAVDVNLGLLAARLRWHVGHFDGTVVTDTGQRLPVEHLLGWSEELVARW